VSDKERALRPGSAGRELASRVLSAAGLAIVALGATALGGGVFALFWAAAAAVFFAEFLAMIGYRPLVVGAAIGAIGLVAANIGAAAPSIWPSLAAVLVAAALIAWRGAGPARLGGALGLAYALCVALPVVMLRAAPAAGLVMTLWLYAVVWGTDIGAFCFGRVLGGPKLWPRVSPKKTGSGLIGGTLVAAAAGTALGLAFAAMPLRGWMLAAASVAASLAAHAGDLAESALKRAHGVKDSSRLIPGHGGVMDRLDGFALAAVVALVAEHAAG
jgi:phosphatidate cytidylyltransferase